MDEDIKEVKEKPQVDGEVVTDEIDENGLRIGIGIDEETKNVVIGFGREVAWVSFHPDEAIQFGEMLINRAKTQLALDGNNK
jgi:hypothetical protein